MCLRFCLRVYVCAWEGGCLNIRIPGILFKIPGILFEPISRRRIKPTPLVLQSLVWSQFIDRWSLLDIHLPGRRIFFHLSSLPGVDPSGKASLPVQFLVIFAKSQSSQFIICIKLKKHLLPQARPAPSYNMRSLPIYWSLIIFIDTQENIDN